MKDRLKEALEKTGAEIATNIRTGYWLTEDGILYTLGWRYSHVGNCIERTREHNELFSALGLGDTDYYNAEKKYKILQYIHESNCIAVFKGIKPTKKQIEFIKKYNVEIVK